MGGYWKIVKTTQAATIVLLRDTPENILRRITFYDIDSRPLARTLTHREKRFYLRQITGDIAYFRRSFQRAHIAVNIAGCSADETCRKVKDALARQNRRTRGRPGIIESIVGPGGFPR